MLRFQHWCGTKQYSWLEWLIPDDHPPVVLKAIQFDGNARHWEVDAMPVDVWPSHVTILKDFQFLGFSSSATGAIEYAFESVVNARVHIAFIHTYRHMVHFTFFQTFSCHICVMNGP